MQSHADRLASGSLKSWTASRRQRYRAAAQSIELERCYCRRRSGLLASGTDLAAGIPPRGATTPRREARSDQTSDEKGLQPGEMRWGSNPRPADYGTLTGQP